MSYKPKLIGQVLKEMGVVTDTQIMSALERQKQTPGRKIAEIMMDMGLVTPVQVGEALMEQWRERVERYEGRSLVVKGISSLIDESKDVFDLQRTLMNMLDELDQMRVDLESLYEVSLAIARDQALHRKDKKKS